MTRRMVWIGLAAAAFVVALPLLIGAYQSATDGEIDRYRTVVDITVDDNGRMLTGKSYADCTVSQHHGWNTGSYVGTSHQSTPSFVVLSDRSVLVLNDLDRCAADAPGKSYSYDPAITSNAVVDGRLSAPYAHAYRYHDADEAKSLTLYLQPELFRGGIDGVRVVDARLSYAERKPSTPLPDDYGDAFPWYRRTPRAPVGSDDYGKYDPATRFSGFIVRLNQLDEAQRCDKFDRSADGPILVEGDSWDRCPPWAGDNLGWLVPKIEPGFGRVDYSYNDRSPDKITTRYRAGWLKQQGAPGVPSDDPSESYFYWQPKLCFDGQCFETKASRRSVWSGFRLYYPKANQVISAEWVH